MTIQLACNPPTAKMANVGGKLAAPVNGVITIDWLDKKQEKQLLAYIEENPSISSRFRVIDREAALAAARKFANQTLRPAALRGGLDAGKIAAQEAAALQGVMAHDPRHPMSEAEVQEMKEVLEGRMLATEQAPQPAIEEGEKEEAKANPFPKVKLPGKENS